MQGKLKRTYRTSAELNRKAEYRGQIAFAEMPRLTSMLLGRDGYADVSFGFTLNELGHAMIEGHYQANLQVECQRCLEPMTYCIDQAFNLLIDASEEDIESFQLDSVYTSEGYLDVFEVIEDELILALPIIMMHEESNCNTYWHAESEQETPPAEKHNPFAVLETLKGTD